MNISTENVSNFDSVIKLTLTEEDYQENVNNVLKDYRKTAEIRGFRKGMVPMGIIKKRFGTAILVEEINKIVSKELSKYLVDEKLNFLGEPLPSINHQKPIDWESQKDFEFAFDIGIGPEFELDLSHESDLVPYYFIIISDEMIDERVESYTKNFGEMIDQDIVEEESNIVADFVELDSEGKEKEDGIRTCEAMFLVRVVKDDEIKKSLIGANNQQIITFNIRKAFPNDDEIASMLKIDKEQTRDLDGEFQITISKISKYINAQMGQGLYDKAFGEGSINSEEEFRQKIKEQIAGQLSFESDYKFQLDIKEYLLDKYKLELPVDFLKRWLDAVNKDLSMEQIEQDWNSFEKDLQWQLISSKIVKEKNIEVTETELMDMAKKVSLAQFQQYGVSHLPDDRLEMFAKQLLEKEEQKKKIENQKLDEMIFAALKDMVKLDTNEVSVDDFKKLFEPAAQIKTDELKLEEEAHENDQAETSDSIDK